jgi:hypothetical protein
MQRRFRFIRTDLWREGTWLDLWSVVHFLSGLSLGFGLSFFSFGAFPSFLLTVILLIAYELWEAMVRIKEAPTNRVMDVVVGTLGFACSFWVVTPQLTTAQWLFSFEIVLTLNVILAAIGWRASQKAEALKARMRKRFLEKRMALLRRESHLRKKFKR